MATQKEIETLLKAMHKAPPSEHFQRIDKSTVGIRAILKYLSENGEQATAGEISKGIGVSTARVAVLLKKMNAKGFIEKQGDPTDGRIVLVRLTERGRDTSNQLRRDMYAQIGALIDRLGMERLMQFAEISREIRSVMESMNTPDKTD